MFRKAYKYCEKHYDGVAVLSAKYGLLMPFEEIEPYDETLKKMSEDQVRKWSEQTFHQLLTKIDLGDLSKIYFHAGKRYRQYLIPMLEKRGIKCEEPLKNMGIGKQLAWYRENDC